MMFSGTPLKISYVVALLLVSSIVALPSSSIAAAPVCATATLYIGAQCDTCLQITREAAASIATLVSAKRLAVIELDDTNREGEVDGLPDFQVFDTTTHKMLELFQTNPPENPPQHLIVKDASTIVPRLNELAMEVECNVPLTTPRGTAECSDGISNNDNDASIDDNDPECHSDGIVGNEYSYMRGHNSELRVPTANDTPFSLDQLSARGVSSSVIDAASQKISSFFAAVGSGFMAIIEFIMR